ncbi:MAG: hypothetical protein K6E21_02085 [Bacilli bacterium]|nr:hypothetical protein [Bacilli bacterium]
MEYSEFKDKYAETMLNYQAIENDIKCIYAYMKAGDINKHFEEIEEKTLGQMIQKLKELDHSHDKHLICSGDYNFLAQICENRNHWAHKVFIAFIYKRGAEKIKAYEKQCAKLDKDLPRVKEASDILEEIRIKYCKTHKR